MVRLAAAAAAIVLAACAGPGERGGAPSAGMSCPQACNRSHAVCSETEAAGRSLGPFSGADTCTRELRQCLAACPAAR